MEAENEVGKLALGIEISTESLESQMEKLRTAMEKAVGDAGRRATEESGKAGGRAGRSFLSGFERQASDTGVLGGFAKKIAGAFAAAFAAKKIFDFGKLSISLGSDLAEVQNVVDSTFGQGSKAQKAVNEFAQNAAAQFGLSETMAKRYAGTFGAMSRAFGFTNQDAAEMSTTLAGLAGDVASFYNLNQDEAFTKLKSVFTGETESLKDLGVVMTQAALDQYALQNGFGKTTSAMSEQEKVALRYRFVLDKLSTASGDFARTSDGWANQVRLLKLQFESLAATIGQVLIAALTPAIKALNAFMGALVKAANTFKSFIFSLFGLDSQDMGTGSGSALPDALGDITSGADDASKSLGGVGDAAKGAGDDAAKAADKINRSLTGFDKITKLTANSSSAGGGSSGGSGGSGSGAGGAGSLGDTSSALKDTAYSVEGMSGPLDKILGRLKELRDLFMGGFWEGLGDTAVFDSIRQNLDGIREKLTGIFTDPAVVEAARSCADKIAENLGKVTGSVVSIGATIADNLTGGFYKYLDQHESDIKAFLVRIFDTTGQIADTTGKFAASVADVFSVFRSDEAKQTTADIINIFSTAFGTTIELALSFANDVLKNITKPFTDNKDKIKKTLEGSIGQISTVMSGVSSTVEKACNTMVKLYDEHISPLLDSIGDGVSELVGNVLDNWNKHIKPVLDNLSVKTKDVLENHVQPMLESIGEALGSILDVAKELWEKVLKPMLKWIEDNVAPIAADILDAFGPEFLDGIGKAADAAKELSDDIKAVADFIKDLIDWEGKFTLSNLREEIQDSLDEIMEFISFLSNPAGWIAGKIIEFPIKPKVENNSDGWLSDIVTWWGDKFGGGKNEQEFSSGPKNESGGWLGGIKETWNNLFGKNKNEQRFSSGPEKSNEGWLGGIKSKWNDLFGGDKNTQKFNTEGNVTRLTDSVPEKKKRIDEVLAAFTKGEDGLPKSDKTIDSTANFTGRQKGSGFDSLLSMISLFTGGKKGEKFNSELNMTSIFTGRDKGSNFNSDLSMTSLFTDQKKGGKFNSELSMTSLFTGRKKGSKFNSELGMKADFTSRKDSLSSSEKQFSSKADFTSRKNSLSDDEKKFSTKADFTSSKDSLSSGDKTISSKAKFTSYKESFSSTPTISVKAKVTSVKTSGGHYTMAEGGVIKYGRRFPIQSFAGGGSPFGGQIFRARENGNPELIGTLRGSTAVMNNDQIVASVSSGVAKAISGIKFYMEGRKDSINAEAYLPRLVDVGNGVRSDTAQLAEMARQAQAASGSGRIEELIELLSKIYEIIREWDPDVYMDADKVTARIVQVLNNRRKASGRSAVII